MKNNFLIAALSLTAIGILGCSKETSTFTVNTSLSSSASIVKSMQARDCDRSRIPCSGSPESMTMKVYMVYLGKEADCSDAALVSDFGAAGKEVDLGVDPLIQASPAPGTYKCLILKISDNLGFIPDAVAVADHAACVANTKSIFDIYRTDSGDSPFWKNLDGTTITATGAGSTPGDDTIFIFGSTDMTVLTSGPKAPHTNQTLLLTGALTVPGQTTFYVDFQNGVAQDGGVCKIEGGAGLGFR